MLNRSSLAITNHQVGPAGHDGFDEQCDVGTAVLIIAVSIDDYVRTGFQAGFEAATEHLLEVCGHETS